MQEKTKRRAFLVLNSMIWILLLAVLGAACVQMYEQGMVRRAADPRAAVFEAGEAVRKLRQILPLGFVAFGFSALSLRMGIRDRRAGLGRSLEMIRDGLEKHSPEKPEEAKREKTRQKFLGTAGIVFFFLCMVPVGVYMAGGGQFPEQDPEQMLSGLIRVLVPWTAAGFGALAVAEIFRERSLKREITALSAGNTLKEEKGAADMAAGDRQRKVLQCICVLAALALIAAGICNGSAMDVLIKAVTICTECVGLG